MHAYIFILFDFTSYPLLTLTVILSILNKNLIYIDYCCWVASSVFCNKENPNPAITLCKCNVGLQQSALSISRYNNIM